MKLRGINSSKARRVVHERNQSVRAPGDPMLAGHKPTPWPDGSLACSGCGTGMRYSPAAFAVHLTGRGGVVDAENGVYTIGPRDPWLAQRTPAAQEQAADAAAAERRAEMIDAYYKDLERPQQRVAKGGNSSAFFD